MIKSLIPLTMLSPLCACATVETPSEPLDVALFAEAALIEEAADLLVEIIERPVALPLPGQLKSIETSNDESVDPAEAIQTGRENALIEPSVDGYVNAIQVYPYTEGALYRLYGGPGQISDIALQPGETLVSVSAGDTVRWVVGDTVSGSGPGSRAHVLVKPITGGITTNLMIATDRRTYHLELISVESGYMAALSWRYPADAFAGLTARNERAQARSASTAERALSLDTLNFDYSISGDDPDWKPLRAFDDGAQVFIQMPVGLGQSEAPPLFVMGEDGAELVNYRVRGGYYIVDHLFEAAELRLGQKNQTVVRISKGKPRSGLAAWFGG